MVHSVVLGRQNHRSGVNKSEVVYGSFSLLCVCPHSLTHWATLQQGVDRVGGCGRKRSAGQERNKTTERDVMEILCQTNDPQRSSSNRESLQVSGEKDSLPHSSHVHKICVKCDWLPPGPHCHGGSKRIPIRDVLLLLELSLSPTNCPSCTTLSMEAES